MRLLIVADSALIRPPTRPAQLISCADQQVQTFLPAGQSAAQAKAFDELVGRLQRMQRLRCIELEVAEKPVQLGKYRRKYIAAIARCTHHGRHALRLLGEQ
jgi:hypothetical protein